MRVDWKELDFSQPFNRGAAMRALGVSVDGVILETDDKATWLNGWRWQDERAENDALVPILWQLAVRK